MFVVCLRLHWFFFDELNPIVATDSIRSTNALLLALAMNDVPNNERYSRVTTLTPTHIHFEWQLNLPF